MRKLLFGSVFLLFAALVLADVRTDYDPSARFNEYRTFAWRMTQADPTGLADNSLVQDRVQGAVSRELVNKGLRENNAHPDVYLSYSFTTRERADADPGWWGWRHRWDYDVYRYTEGILTLDMVDAKTNQLVWRAYGTNTGNDPVDVQSQKKIDKLVSSAFKKFPPQIEEKG
jgi:hypothetical protein